jgi:hypothetical protein
VSSNEKRFTSGPDISAYPQNPSLDEKRPKRGRPGEQKNVMACLRERFAFGPGGIGRRRRLPRPGDGERHADGG